MLIPFAVLAAYALPRVRALGRWPGPCRLVAMVTMRHWLVAMVTDHQMLAAWGDAAAAAVTDQRVCSMRVAMVTRRAAMVIVPATLAVQVIVATPAVTAAQCMCRMLVAMATGHRLRGLAARAGHV